MRVNFLGKLSGKRPLPKAPTETWILCVYHIRSCYAHFLFCKHNVMLTALSYYIQGYGVQRGVSANKVNQLNIVIIKYLKRAIKLPCIIGHNLSMLFNRLILTMYT